jgi:NADH-quinone oxidoreductase subunit G
LSKNAAESHLFENIQSLATMLQNSQRPVIVCGTDIVNISVITAAADLALQLQDANKRAGLFYVLPGANAYGAAIVSAGSEPFSELLGAIENGEVRALLLVETDFLYHFHDQARVKSALRKLELLVVMDYLPNRAQEFVGQTPVTIHSSVSASSLTYITFPTLTHFETHASFINQEGRLQQATPVHADGMPLSQLTGGKHPPREFRNDIPGGGAKAAWRIFSELEAAILPSHPAMTSFDDLWSRIAQELNTDVQIENSKEIPDKLRIFSKNISPEPVAWITGSFIE